MTRRRTSNATCMGLPPLSVYAGWGRPPSPAGNSCRGAGRGLQRRDVHRAAGGVEAHHHHVARFGPGHEVLDRRAPRATVDDPDAVLVTHPRSVGLLVPFGLLHVGPIYPGLLYSVCGGLLIFSYDNAPRNFAIAACSIWRTRSATRR